MKEFWCWVVGHNEMVTIHRTETGTVVVVHCARCTQRLSEHRWTSRE